MKILVIEDQEMTWDIILRTLVRICKIDPADIERARFYTEAQGKIETGRYDLVFLDHRMPREDPGCTDREDFDRFARQLENIGYGLLPLIEERQPQATVVGTSSLSEEDLRGFRLPSIRMDKTSTYTQLPLIVRSLT